MTQKMKVLVLTAMMLMPIARGACQGMPVYDNTNFISFAKSLVEAGKQTSQIIKTVQFLKKQKENIEKVSNVIKQLKAVKEIAKNNQRLFNTVQDDLRDILNSPYIKPEEITRVSESFDAIIENSLNTLEFMSQILSSDSLKMTDAERAAVLKEKELESQKMVAEIEQKTKRYRDIISFRKMQSIINTRETVY